jgi:hypothetical protein
MEAAPLDGDGAMIQDAYPWETGDRYAGMPYEQEMPKLDATPLPATNLYLPSLHQ